MSRRATGIALALVAAAISGFATVFLNGYAVKRFDDATAATTARTASPRSCSSCSPCLC